MFVCAVDVSGLGDIAFGRSSGRDRSYHVACHAYGSLRVNAWDLMPILSRDDILG